MGDQEEDELGSSGELHIWLLAEAEPVQKMSGGLNTVIREACGTSPGLA